MKSETLIKSRVIGVDVNVDQTTLAIVDLRGSIIARDSFDTMSYPSLNDFVSTLSERITMLAETNGGYETIRSVGVSAPSANFVTGCVENAINMPWKGTVPLAALLRDRLGLAVALANDAHSTALGEKEFGSAHGMQDFIVVSLGHGGVGSCVFCKGKPNLGSYGFAGEIGHVCIVPGGRQCSCGRKGCLEQYTSARGMRQTAEELLARHDGPSLLREQKELSPETIADCCEKGDTLAIEVMRQTGQILGLGLANYATVLNPEAIILTGNLSKIGHWMMDPMRESFDEHVFHNIRGKVKLLTSILDDHERDVLGASALAWEVKEYSLFI